MVCNRILDYRDMKAAIIAAWIQSLYILCVCNVCDFLFKFYVEVLLKTLEAFARLVKREQVWVIKIRRP